MEYAIKKGKNTEVSYMVDESQLRFTNSKTGESVEIPHTEVIRIRLFVSQGIGYMYIKAREHKLKIISRSMEGVGKFVNRQTEYRTFVESYHHTLGSANKDVKLLGGSTAMFILGCICIVLGLSGFVLKWGFGIRYSLRLAFALAIGIPAVVAGISKTYSAETIPQKYLPRS